MQQRRVKQYLCNNADSVPLSECIGQGSLVDVLTGGGHGTNITQGIFKITHFDSTYRVAEVVQYFKTHLITPFIG